MSISAQLRFWAKYVGSGAALRVLSGGTTPAECQGAAAAFEKRLDGAAALNSTDVVLDIGAGLGFHGQRLAARCRLWIGVDIIADHLSRTPHAPARSEKMAWIVTNGYDLSCVSDRSATLVYSTSLFLH